ncbi:nSTAND3 domain-containing NTPase [Flavobacterium sp. MAHUQ-51]|uniref:nSTAND3 domain-containing NTPase n=1 Tax=Flavobacterium sp. GCM10022190 TaxID=3252639 RepID=UPI0036071847
MNFIKQIEVALTTINEARFQDLINHLLHVQGNMFIGAPGSVVGKEKTSKGAPDSFFVKDDKYVFVECTTKDKLDGIKTFIEKLEKDIEHCFDEEKTKIKNEDVEKVILACTSKIDADEHYRLKSKVKNYNINAEFEILDIQNLPLYIYDFPGLSEQYLGVEIIKGEIYNLPDFLIKTTKGLQPSLINDFIAREDELKQSLEHLKNLDILLLSGSAGVGKSKLAVKILEDSKEDFIPIVIQSSAVPLWDDFVHLFQNGKDYIILFDDANKSIQNLAYLLNFIQKPKTNKLKVVITVRDYVKHQVYQELKDFKYQEVIVEKLKDEDIEKIILKVLPNLHHHYDIRKKIIELSKGNARVALMATYSVTPDSEINYLSSPVLLYERYFEKVADEIEAFTRPIIFKTLAIVSFFGALDRNNEELKTVLKNNFDIDWDELWVTILELHRHEILDVYSNEIVKVSDQVLGTYAFYKCFIHSDSASIIYSDWISTFIEKCPSRITTTLVDVNNTFGYFHIKDFVMPHLQSVVSGDETNEKYYSFYTLFWFYKGYDTLIYLKKWIDGLTTEIKNGELKFSYAHNDHTKASKNFDLLINFWNHPNELLKPAIELSIDLVAKQPNRLPEFLKFIHDHFSYKVEDLHNEYQRQNILLEILSTENRSPLHKEIANGTFLHIGETLLGWHFTEFGSKGIEFRIVNFDLYHSSQLLELRAKILDVLYNSLEEYEELSEKILNKIVYPGGKIDEQIYIDELSIYARIISDKLSPDQYSHCKFVSRLSKKISSLGCLIPDDWNQFINSDIIKLSKLLKTDFLEDRNGKSWQEREQEKRQKIQAYIKPKTWNEIKSLLYFMNSLFLQQQGREVWEIEGGISEIFIGIASKGKTSIKKALNLTFNNEFSFQFQPRIIYFIINNNILSGEELLTLINNSDFKDKTSSIVTLLECLPENQINLKFLELLIQTFKNNNHIYIHRLTDYLKFDSEFNNYKTSSSERGIEKHNIISYLTEIILNKPITQRYDLGHHFCRDCASYFSNHLHLVKQAFISLKKGDAHFDYDGKEFEAVLNLDSNFFIEYLEQKVVDMDYLSFRFERFKLDCIWALPSYKEIVDKALDIIITKAPIFSSLEHPSTVLFNFKEKNDETTEKVHNYIANFINIHFKDRQRTMMIMSVILYRFHNKFISYLKQFLLLNKDIEIFKYIWLETSGVTTGSRVPYIQKEIDFCGEIASMVKLLPNLLDYVEHIKYLEQKIIWLKKDIENEQKRDFEEYL